MAGVNVDDTGVVTAIMMFSAEDDGFVILPQRETACVQLEGDVFDHVFDIAAVCIHHEQDAFRDTRQLIRDYVFGTNRGEGDLRSVRTPGRCIVIGMEVVRSMVCQPPDFTACFRVLFNGFFAAVSACQGCHVFCLFSFVCVQHALFVIFLPSLSVCIVC